MKDIFKKILALAIAGAMIFAFAACSAKTSTETTETTETAETATADETTETADEAVEEAVSTLREPVSGDTYKFGMVLLVENGAFLDMKTGIIQGLEEAGFVEGENIEIDYQCAQGDSTNLNTICQSMADGSYDLVFTIATPPTQAFVGLESSTPNIFCSVAAPVAAGVMSSLDTPDMNATGTSNAVPAGDIIDMAMTMTPDIETFGLVYCTSEVNAVNAMENAKAHMDEIGVAYEEVTVANSSEVQQATESLMGKVDAIFVANDSVVQSAVSLLSDICRENGIPTYCCSATTVQSGCLATLAMSDISIGEQTAEIAVQYLNGTDIADLPCVVVPADYVSVNSDAVEALGIEIPSEITDTYGEIQYLTDAE